MPAQEWETYSVREDGILDNECQEFDVISHVAHIENALSILKSKTLVPQLVRDLSKLKKRRILVNWLSPNFWANGFRYGNVSFSFEFRELIKDKRFYWVEALKHTPTSPTACRILITRVNRDQSPYLDIYDPEQKDGPWWWNKRKDKHHWNSRFALEFMFEGELSLDDCLEIDFVKHHDHQCAIDPSSCVEKGYPADRGATLVIAGAIGQDLTVAKRLCGRRTASGRFRPKGKWDFGFSSLYSKISRLPFGGPIQAGTPESRALARAVMAAVFRRDPDETRALSTLFADSENLLDSLKDLAKETFGLTVSFDD